MKKCLKVLLVKAFPKLRVVLDLALGLRALGHEVEIAVPIIDESVEKAIGYDIPVHVVNIRSSLFAHSFVRKRMLDIKGIYELHRLYKIHHYDIIHLNLLRARVLGRIAHLFGGYETIISTIHGADMENPFYHILEKATNWIDDGTVTISKATKKYVLSKSIKPKILSVVYNGLNIQAYDCIPVDKAYLHKELGLSQQTQLIGIVAYLYPNVKGHEVFLQAACEVLKKFSQTHFIIVGSDPYGENYGKQLKDLAKKIGIAQHVHFLGERHDIPNIMDSLTCLVLPSVVEEGFGLVLIEAMARSISTIGSKIGGISEIIKHNKTGLLVPSRRPEVLAKAIISLLSDPERRLNMGQNGRQLVEKKFTNEIMAKNYEGFYYKILLNHD